MILIYALTHNFNIGYNINLQFNLSCFILISKLSMEQNTIHIYNQYEIILNYVLPIILKSQIQHSKFILQFDNKSVKISFTHVQVRVWQFVCRATLIRCISVSLKFSEVLTEVKAKLGPEAYKTSKSPFQLNYNRSFF